MEGGRFNSDWIWKEYKTYLQRKAFDELSEEDRRNLQNEFEELRPAAYRAALEREASRLNCDVTEVRPKSLVLPWKPNHDEESMLAKLPTEIFARIFPMLDSLDIFRMTLVCQKWKSIVHENSMQLKRAEHAVTTHIITFTEWMDPQKTPSCQTFFDQYQVFSWCLAKWYCGVSENLETLILDHPVPQIYLASLLQPCPNLKQLQITINDAINIQINKTVLATVHLRHLEVFLASYKRFHYNGIHPRSHLHRDVLISSESLRVYRGSLNMEDCSLINARKPICEVFSKLLALDLERFTTSAIRILAQIDNLQLRYLRLGYHEGHSTVNETLDGKEKALIALHQLLPKLSRLEILITSTHVGITNDTIKLLTDLELDLSFAMLHRKCFPKRFDSVNRKWRPLFEVDRLQSDLLIAFQDMLLSNNPDIDLSNIHFVLDEGETLSNLETVETGFTFLTMSGSREAILSSELYHPRMKRRLGVDF